MVYRFSSVLRKLNGNFILTPTVPRTHHLEMSLPTEVTIPNADAGRVDKIPVAEIVVGTNSSEWIFMGDLGPSSLWEGKMLSRIHVHTRHKHVYMSWEIS